jgi:hypothetical protein
VDAALIKFKSRLEKFPDCNNDEYYRMADYIEMKAIANPDGFYAKADFTNEKPKRATDLGEGDIEENRETQKLPNAKKNDKWERFADDIFRNIESRIKEYGEFYPFTLTENNKGIQFNGVNTNEQHYYVLLLYCANLSYTGFTNILTSSFERICEKVLKKFLPQNADVRLFGSSNVEEGDSDEWKTTKLWDKLVWLASFLHAKIVAEEGEISVYNKGDRGLDIVGRVTFDDNLSHFPVFFGQCACSPEQWKPKQMSISKEVWDSLLSLNNYPTRMMFIPQSFRNSVGQWQDRHSIMQSVLVDRHRILKYIKDDDFFKELSSYEVVNSLLTCKESSF